MSSEATAAKAKLSDERLAHLRDFPSAASFGEVRELAEGEAERRAAERWIPVGERMPAKGEYVIATFTNKDAGPFVHVLYWDGRWYENASESILNDPMDHLDVSHWRPLPAPSSSAADAPK